MCVAARNHEKFTKTPNFGNSKSFKVIDVDKCKKPVTSACHDEQHVCTYLQPFSHSTSQYRQNNVFLGSIPLTPSFERNPHPGARNFVAIKTRVLAAATWRFCDPSLHRFDRTAEYDGQTHKHRRQGHG